MQQRSTEQRTARIGLRFFAVYTVFYGTFVYLSAFHPELMASHAGGQVNMSVWYGFTLIISPLVLALVYARLCSGIRKDDDGGKSS